MTEKGAKSTQVRHETAPKVLSVATEGGKVRWDMRWPQKSLLTWHKKVRHETWDIRRPLERQFWISLWAAAVLSGTVNDQTNNNKQQKRWRKYTSSIYTSVSKTIFSPHSNNSCSARKWPTFLQTPPHTIHEKNEWCGGDGFFCKKKFAENLAKKRPKIALKGLKLPKMA